MSKYWMRSHKVSAGVPIAKSQTVAWGDRAPPFRSEAPDFCAIVRDHNQLLDVIRKRIVELNINYETVEVTAGLSSGYLPKILGNPPPKRLQPFLAFILLDALGLRVEVKHDGELLDKVRSRLIKRKARRKSGMLAASKHQPIRIELAPDFLARIQRLGGEARAIRLSPERRAAIARHAARARWQNAKQIAAAS